MSSITKLYWNELDGTVADVNDVKPIADKVDDVIDVVNPLDDDVQDIKNSLSTGYQYLKGEFIVGSTTAQKWEVWEYNNQFWISLANDNTETPSVSSSNWALWDNFRNCVDDTSTATDKLWSANKINSELNNKADIDFGNVSNTDFRTKHNSVAIAAFYVDATNGDDNNDGLSSSTAFQTLAKAISSVPIGGYGIIYLVGGSTVSSRVTYNINSDIEMYRKFIDIYAYDDSYVLITNTSYDNGSYNYYYGIRLIDSSIMFNCKKGHIKLQPGNLSNSSLPIVNGVAGMIRSYAGTNSVILGYKWQSTTDDDSIYIPNNTGHIVVIETEARQSFCSVKLKNVQIKQETTTQSNKLIYLNNSTMSFSASGTTFVDGTGATISHKDCVSGIVTYASGEPMNIISNLDFS